MKTPIMNTAADVTSVTYWCSPSIERCNGMLHPSPSRNLAVPAHEEPLFKRQGDYWVIQYQGRVAFLKATRGLQCLSLLLDHPGREFYVSELLELGAGRALTSANNGHLDNACQRRLPGDAGPILDPRAKAEYKLRLEDLRAELDEAERFCDPGRAEQARNEIDFLAQQLASAVGLGGRDRRIGSETERARCAVTKRIKDAMSRIGEVIPSLRSYLASRIRTGYFCSYNLSQEHPVVWKVIILLTVLCCPESYHTS